MNTSLSKGVNALIFEDEMLVLLTETFNEGTLAILAKIAEMSTGREEIRIHQISDVVKMNQHRFTQELVRLEVSRAISIKQSSISRNAKSVVVTENGLRILEMFKEEE